MSLTLIQGYSSAEDEEQQQETLHHFDSNSSDEENDDETVQNDAVPRFTNTYTPISAPQSSQGSALPSALDVFSEVSGPPRFLNNCVEEQSLGKVVVPHQRWRNRSRDKRDLPTGVVVEAKAQLVGIHERVRSDVEGNAPSTTSGLPQNAPSATTSNTQPSMCLQCGIPKVYTSALGMACPVCTSADAKKKGSTVKDKEKSKRMKGQSSHASWKSETEMQLRQTFD